MVDKKETIMFIGLGAFAIGCCLFLQILLVGGFFTVLGAFFTNNLLFIFGLSVILMIIISLFIRRKVA